MFLIKFVGEPNGAVKLTVGLDHGGGVQHVRGAVDVFVLDKDDKASVVPFLKQPDGGPSHLGERRLLILVPVKLKAHILKGEEPEHFTAFALLQSLPV